MIFVQALIILEPVLIIADAEGYTADVQLLESLHLVADEVAVGLVDSARGEE